MKKGLLFIGAVCLSLVGFAQNFSVSEDSIYLYGEPSEFELYANVDVINISGEDLTVKVQATAIRSNEEVVMKYCFGEFCYNDLSPVYEGAMMANDTAVLKGQYNPFDTEDYGIIHFYISDSRSLNPEKTVKMVFDTKGISSVEESVIDSKRAQVSEPYPNPAKTEAKFSYQLQSGFHSAYVEIKDITGATLGRDEISSSFGVHTIQLSQFPAGVYFYAMVVDGVQSETQRLIVVQ